MTSTAIALPTDAMSAMQLARELSNSRLVPTPFQKSPADIFLVMSTCARLGLDFFLTIGECYVVRNRLMFSGKLSAAIIHASGALADRLSFEYSGEGKDRKVTVSARLVNETAPRTVEVELAKVKTENDIWVRQPDQQLSYAGARIWGRRHVPEVLLGMLFEGETIDITPTVVMREAPIPTTPANIVDEPLDPQPARVSEGAEPFAIPFQEGSDWRPWAMQLLAYVRGAADVDTICEWMVRNEETLAQLKAQEPDKHKRLVDMLNHQIAMRQEGHA